jgi:hypothetical protein
MARNRVIYQSEALFVSKNINSTGSNEHKQLARVQSANYNFNIARQDVNQFGQLARIDALVLQSPTVSLDFSYYLTDGFNERALGFYVGTGVGSNYSEGNFSSGQMGSSSGQNFFIVTTVEGSDLNYDTGAAGRAALSGKSVIALGNGFLTNYSIEAGVGNLATASVTIEALNMTSTTYSGGALNSAGMQTPAIDPTAGTAKGEYISLPNPSTGTSSDTSIPSALRPGDITLDFGGYTGTTSTTAGPMSNVSMTSSDSINIQSLSVSLPLSRTPIERLGSRFAFARVVDFPILAKLDVKANVNEVIARNLANLLDDSTERDITVTIKNHKDTAKNALVMKFKGSRLTSESYSSSIGSNKTVDLSFETQIGGPNDTVHGIFVSGAGIQEPSVLGWGY